MVKTCGKCNETKPAGEFYRDKSTKDGLQSQCKMCKREYEQSEKGKMCKREYRQSEKYKQSQRQYRQSEQGKQVRRRLSNIRRTRKTKAGGSFTNAEWRRLCKFYDFHCLKCNIEFPFTKLTPDHIKALSKSGPNFIWNLQPLCGPCNSSKNNKEIDYRQTLPDWINRDGPIWIQGSLI